MKIPTKKLKSGFEMPVYGLGTWQMGGRYNRDPHNDDEADIRAIQEAIDAGVTHIDTAEMYARGRAEELVAEAINGYDRKKLFIVSKVLDEHLKYDDVLKAFEASLKRLRTSYLDLYLIHAPNSSIPLKDTMRAFNKLKDEGLIKNIGVSNFNVEQMQEAQAHTLHKVVANQVHYNLEIREMEKRGVLEYCQTQDIILIAYRPIQKGALLKNAPIVQELSKKYDKTPYQIAINWLISQPNVVTLSKTRNLEHLRENLEAINWQMDKEDIERLRREFPGQKETSDIATLD